MNQFFLIIFILNVLTMILNGWNYFSGNEISAIFFEIQSVQVLNLIIFSELMKNEKT